jgi:hypothetical protein
MKILNCPKCGQEFHVADNVTAAYCGVGHMTAAYHEGLPAEDGKVYAIGWRAWFEAVCQLVYALKGLTFIPVRLIREHYDAQQSPAEAVWLEYGVHL